MTFPSTSFVNRYGFKHRVLYTAFVAAIFYLIFRFLGEFVVGPMVYRSYDSTLDLSPGSVGSRAWEDLPVALSISDLEKYEKCTIQVMDYVVEERGGLLDGVTFHALPLASGEIVAACINLNEVYFIDDPASINRQLAVLPVGQWKPFSELEEEQEYFWQWNTLSSQEYYVDMMGDFGRVSSAAAFGAMFGALGNIAFVLTCILHRIWGVRSGKFAPAVLSLRDPALPRNDLELWSTSVYALWEEAFPAFDGWPVVGGLRKNRSNSRWMRQCLERDWGISNKADGLVVVEKLLEKGEDLRSEEMAWNDCRGVQLLAMYYVAGFLDRDELDQMLSRVCRMIQTKYPDWDCLMESYLCGYEAWTGRNTKDRQPDQTRRRLCTYLKNLPGGPYSVPWNADLSFQMSGQASKEIYKKILRSIPVSNGTFSPVTGRH